MALLTPSPLESTASMPPPSPHELQPVLQASSSAPVAPPARAPSSKMPRGRHLGGGDRAVYDVDSRLPGESQPPQLEVTPITKYNSDPGLVLGRQIAVNRSYICYGLKLGNIRVLNINTALRALLRGHTQRVTDMAFFAEDVHLLASASADGRVYVWKIDEGRDEENKPQISGKIVTAIQIVGDGEPYHPRICWHSHKQEILVVGIGNYVLKLDTTKVGRGKAVSADEPLICDVEKLSEGMQLVGKHDGEVTDLSISQWMTTRLASASKDGTIKIWEDRRTMPLATLRPHGGQPVNSVEFLTSPHRPNHIVLITAGPLNREVKIWTSTGDEGWLLPSDSESWQCTQTLELRSSSEPQTEEAFFNQVVVLPRSSIILLANAKKNAIYAVHVDYGSCPSSTRMDYIADFTVAIPILSLTGTSDYLPDGEPVVQVYCVQTQAIQQYALVLSQCLPPPNDNIIPGKDSSISCSSEGLDVIVSSQGSNIGEVSTVLDVVASNAEAMPSASVSEVADISHVASSSPLPLNLELSVRISALKPPPKVLEKGPSLGDSDVDQSVLDSDISVVPNSHLTFKLGGGNAAHLITPAELMAGAISSSENTLVNQGEGKLHGATISKDVQSEVEVAVLGDSRPSQHEIVDFQTPEPRDEMVRECGNLTKESISVEEASLVDGIATAGPSEQPFRVGEEETRDGMREMLENVTGFAVTTASISGSDAKGKKHKGKQGQALDPSSPSLSRLNSTYSSNEPESSESVPLTEVAFSQIQTVQETLNQLVAMQTEMEKQISTMVTANATKEGKRLEAALGRSMEKVVKANVDALWARMQEENAKHEKAEKERMQQITSLITTCTNKDLPSILDRALKKEISALGTNVARAITPVIEKAISSAITESFQRGVGDKAVNQLEKSVNSKLEATVARHIQAQFQTSGKQILQDALRSSLESSLIPTFEVACKAMFEQVDTTFQKGMTEYASTAQQQLESAHTPLALTLRDAINSASSITQNMTSELADGQRKLLALVAAGNPKALNPITMQQQSNGPVNIRPDMVEAPLDPKKELTRLISEHNYVDAFTSALQRSDVSIVSWLCSQVDLRGICSTVPLPLSQGVLLALLQQLACDINNDTPRKLSWMMSVAVAINPSDPMIALHVRPILEQVYNILAHLRSSSPATSPTEVRTIMLVINSVLMSCK